MELPSLEIVKKDVDVTLWEWLCGHGGVGLMILEVFANQNNCVVL